MTKFICEYSRDALRPKKNIVCFRFPTDPIKTCATQIYFIDFPPFFFFKEIHKLRDELLAVVKVTKKTLRKGEEGLKNIKKNKKSLRNVQIKHAWQ